MNAVTRYEPFTQEDRLAHVLGQLWGGEVEGVEDPALRYLFPSLTPFQVDFAEWALSPTSPDRLAVYGGIGCGKTFGIALTTYLVAMTRPGSYSLLTTDSYRNLSALLLPECRRAFGGLEVDGVVYCPPAAEYHGGEYKWTFTNGSVVQLRYYVLKSTQDEAQNPIEGHTVTGVLLADEVQKLPPKLLDHAEERTRGASRDVLDTLHPPKLALLGRPGAIDWWKRAVKDRGGAVLEPRTRDNPHNGARYMDKLREGRTPAQYYCIIGEGPAPVEGAAYECFSTVAEGGGLAYWPHGNIIRASVCDGPGEVVIGLDPGFGNPAVIFVRPVRLLLGPPWRSREVTAHVVLDDMSPSEVTTPELIRQVTRRLSLRGWTARTLIADPAGMARNAQTGQSDLSLFARPRTYTGDHIGPGLGVNVVVPSEPAKRHVLTGIGRVQALMCNAEDPPLRLLLCTDAHWQRCEAAGTEVRNFRNSILQYTMAIATQKSSSGRDHRSTHIADALRYVVAMSPGAWQATGGAARPPEHVPTNAELAWADFTTRDR